MNLRILKKLSKRAAPLLIKLGDETEQFAAKTGENYHGLVIRARKHWERHECHPNFEGFPGDIVIKTKTGRKIVMRPPSHPLKGTIMVGGTSGYYEPEWHEETAWGALAEMVYWHFTEYDDDAEELKPTRVLRSPSDILRAANEMVAANEGHS